MKETEEDQVLKTMLSQHGVEEVSQTFTKNVMSRIKDLNTATAIINNKWKRIYRMAFTLISLMIITLSFLIKPDQLPFNISIQLSKINDESLVNIILYILVFWLLIGLSVWMDKRKSINY